MSKLAWSIPPLLGLVAFVGARTMTPAAEVGPAKSEAAEAAQVHGKPSAVASAIEQAKREEEAAAASPQDFPADNEALKAEYLKLKQKLKSLYELRNWEAARSCEERYRKMTIELGRRLGAEAEKWILEVEPSSVFLVIEGWAESDPAGAFRSVVSSDRRRPCSDFFLMKLIAAQKDGEGMKAAVQEVPWHLYDLSVYYPSLHGDTPMREIPFPVGLDPKDWVESGAALAMAEKGVQISRFFYLWAQQNPEEALAHWESWPDERPQTAKARMLEIFEATADDDALVARLRGAWEKMPAADQRKLAEIFEEHNKSYSYSGWSEADGKLNHAFKFLDSASTKAPSE